MSNQIYFLGLLDGYAHIALIDPTDIKPRSVPVKKVTVKTLTESVRNAQINVVNVELSPTGDSLLAYGKPISAFSDIKKPVIQLGVTNVGRRIADGIIAVDLTGYLCVLAPTTVYHSTFAVTKSQ